jgi:hypothetical protein
MSAPLRGDLNSAAIAGGTSEALDVTPPEIERPPATKEMRPAFPVPSLALEAMPVAKLGLPALSMTSSPAALTATSPASPRPNVDVEITPLFRIEMLSAATLTRTRVAPIAITRSRKNPGLGGSTIRPISPKPGRGSERIRVARALTASPSPGSSNDRTNFLERLRNSA